MPRTLPTILKFERRTSEEEVMAQLARLFDVALKEEYTIEPLSHRPSPASMPLHIVAQEQTSVVESRGLPVDLFAVARGEQKVGKSDWKTAVGELFVDLEKRKILSGPQSSLLRDRILSHTTDMDDTTRSALNILQKLSSQPGSRIDESPQVRDAFNMFTITAFGANDIEYIARRLAGLYKKEVSSHAVERRVIGGIAAVTEPRNV